LLFGFQIPELHVLENDFQRVADAAKLPPVASDLIEELALEVGFARCAEIDVDEAELSTLLIEGHRIDCLP
jgi:hypothetical protein